MPRLTGPQHIYIKNVDNQPVVLPELGGYSLAAGAEVDLLDKSLPVNYAAQPQAAWRAVTDMPTTTLYQLTHSTPPKLALRVVA